jgi:hypothetical protein
MYSMFCKLNIHTLYIYIYRCVCQILVIQASNSSFMMKNVNCPDTKLKVINPPWLLYKLDLHLSITGKVDESDSSSW